MSVYNETVGKRREFDQMLYGITKTVDALDIPIVYTHPKPIS